MNRAVGIVLFVTACGPSAHEVRVATRQETARSWSGATLLELESHPYYAPLRKAVKPLSDGTSMWIYTTCVAQNRSSDCQAIATGNRYVTSASGHCEESGGGLMCCHNEFRIRDDRVVSMQMSGKCFWDEDCAKRPDSASCNSSR